MIVIGSSFLVSFSFLMLKILMHIGSVDLHACGEYADLEILFFLKTSTIRHPIYQYQGYLYCI